MDCDIWQQLKIITTNSVGCIVPFEKLNVMFDVGLFIFLAEKKLTAWINLVLDNDDIVIEWNAAGEKKLTTEIN